MVLHRNWFAGEFVNQQSRPCSGTHPRQQPASMFTRPHWKSRMSTRKRSVNTAGRWGANRSPAKLAVLLVLAGLLISSCSAGGQFDPQPTATAPADAAESPTPTDLPFAGTQTAESAAEPLVIERVVLSTSVDENGAPANE